MRQTLTIFLFALSVMAMAQSRNTPLTITVSGVAGDNLDGQAVELTQTDYQASYGNLKLNAEGRCTVNVYAGNHRLTINRSGFETATKDFTITENVAAEVNITLVEKTRNPFALTTSLVHDAYSGKNSVEMSWNIEPPVFFDDFESYEPFAIEFGEWTGIDADDEFAAPLLGSYPNRGVKQYAQIINPLTVTPTWWYDYPILRPYSGNQYAGFTRTNTGNANDDWLISPVITPGTDNVL
ncbi:MAG: carboxypeptidase regulatory-like domain-containing protein, partial [Prevotella sp.]|nr:carboxypeptidase regulatory-like domain-containing protein [Prevotella sp.]